jgi:nitrite reductase/ring-hydroxylating ferredoxin subunit/hemoglobin-like flavoprotein
MSEQTNLQTKAQSGAEDASRYFQYMADFVGLSKEDIAAITQTAPVIEHHLPEIVGKFYSHLLRYPPTRKFFLKKDGSLDQEYVELRMRHLTNFWLRAAQGNFDDEFARYIDYVGRAHTSRGADPKIYIAERYVIGQVGFMQHAIGEAITRDLRHVNEELETDAIEAWDRLMMVILEMLARAYGHEREAETFDALVTIDQGMVDHLAQEAFQVEHNKAQPVAYKDIVVGPALEIPENGRKIIHVGDTSIGIFNHKGQWVAHRNSCLHRGGPVCTGSLNGDVITCPWHGFQYNVLTGQLLVDPSAKLESYEVKVINGELHVRVPDHGEAPAAPEAPIDGPKPNEFKIADVAPGQAQLLSIDGQGVVVFNLDGQFYAAQSTCTHQGGPLDQGEIERDTVTCPLHGSCFNIKTGEVVNGPAHRTLKTFSVKIDGEIGRVEVR